MITKATLSSLLANTTRIFIAMGLLATANACSDDDNSQEENAPPIDNVVDIPLSQAQMAPSNPFLASGNYSITHFNSGQTDAFPYAVKDGNFTIDPYQCDLTWGGPVNLMTLSSTSANYMWGMSSDRVSYINVADGKFERVAEAPLPGIPTRTKEQLLTLCNSYSSYSELKDSVVKILGEHPQMSIANGNYVFCDKDNYVYTNAGRTMARYRLANAANPSEGIVLDSKLDLSAYMNGGFTLVGATMTFDGHVLVASQKSLVLIDRALTTVEDSWNLPDDQILTNSMAVDENSVYLASNSTTANGKGVIQKIVCSNGKFSTDEAKGAWKATYDGGPLAPCIKLGYGTGSTPTLMGFGSDEDKLVVITDGAQHMKLIAFWRDEIPADAKVVDSSNPRLAGVFNITCGLPASTEWIQSEQSVVVGGYDAFVVNNIEVTPEKPDDKIIGVLAIGPVLQGPKGVECVRWNTTTNQWESRWTRADIRSTSMIPCVSTASEMVFVNGWYDDAGWKITGLDWRTGKTRHQVTLGKDNRGNGAYAILQYFPNGDLLFNSVAGPFRAKLK